MIFRRVINLAISCTITSLIILPAALLLGIVGVFYRQVPIGAPQNSSQECSPLSPPGHLPHGRRCSLSIVCLFCTLWSDSYMLKSNLVQLVYWKSIWSDSYRYHIFALHTIHNLLQQPGGLSFLITKATINDQWSMMINYIFMIQVWSSTTAAGLRDDEILPALALLTLFATLCRLSSSLLSSSSSSLSGSDQS